MRKYGSAQAMTEVHAALENWVSTFMAAIGSEVSPASWEAVVESLDFFSKNTVTDLTLRNGFDRSPEDGKTLTANFATFLETEAPELREKFFA